MTIAMSTLSAVMAGIGAVTSVVGGIEQGQAQAQAAQAAAAAQEQQAVAQNEAMQAAAQQSTYQAQVASNNASIAQQNQTMAERAAAAQATAQSMQAAQGVGQVKAAAASGGLDPDTGTPAAVAMSGRLTGQQNTLNAWNNQMLAAYGYQQQASNFKASQGLYNQQAQQDLLAGKYDLAGGQLALAAGNQAAGNDQMGGILTGVGSGLNDAGNIGMKWAGMSGTNAAVGAANSDPSSVYNGSGDFNPSGTGGLY